MTDHTPNTQGASWEEVELAPEGTALATFQKERTDAISEMFDNKYANGIYPTSRFFARLDRCVAELLSKERVEGERRGAERCVVILEKYLNADEVVRNGQRFLVIDGADVPYGYPYPDNRLKYALRAITTLPADSTEDTTNLTT